MDDLHYRRHLAGCLNKAKLHCKKATERDGVLLLHHDTATANACINTQGMPGGWPPATFPLPSKGKAKPRAGTFKKGVQG